jgi:DNA-binding SARP family transcriptional activator
MSKVGRNDPCPCGSGKKFKRCCIARVEAEARVERVEAEVEREEGTDEVLDLAAKVLDGARALEEMNRLSEHAERLIKKGRLDEAEAVGRRLVEAFPGETVGYEDLALVHEARGQRAAAAEEYRRAVALMDEQGEGNYCDCCRARMVKAIRRLDPDRPAPALLRDPQ